MYMGFWEKLKKPILALAPMADVTDAAFRLLMAHKSKFNDVGESLPVEYISWTEFISADGLARAPEEGQKKLRKALIYGEVERPVVAQFFGSNPEYMEEAARLARELQFDGIDINMGCPDRAVEKQGAGSAMIKTPDVASAVIEAVLRGAQDERSGKKIPVSVKTRLGYNKDELDTWLPHLLQHDLAAITIHARTRKEMSKVPAHWDRLKDAVILRNKLQKKTLIIGNGDITSIKQGKELVEKTGIDGVMFGRGVFGNPWFFNEEKGGSDNIVLPIRGKVEGEKVKYSNAHISSQEKLQALIDHAELFDALLGDTKNFAVMKKHIKAYISGFTGAKELRERLMHTENKQEMVAILKKQLSSYLF